MPEACDNVICKFSSQQLKRNVTIVLLFFVGRIILVRAFLQPSSCSHQVSSPLVGYPKGTYAVYKMDPVLSSSTFLNLFFGENAHSAENSSKFKQKSRIPPHITEKLEMGEVSLPLTIFPKEEVGISSSISTNSMSLADDKVECQSKKTLIVRQVDKTDLPIVVRMCVQEYGSYSTESYDNSTISKFLKPLFDYVDNWVFSFVVLLGLTQRVDRRKISEEGTGLIRPDHNVICISEVGKNGKEIIVGMAEVSLQPPYAGLTAPPYVAPMVVKEFISFLSGVRPPSPYISNVLISEDYRGLGYSKILMKICEGLAKRWGYNSVYLHVDADLTSGATAQRLYRSLGYRPVIDKSNDQRIKWMGPEMINKGLYIVDGVALLFLKKDLIK
mmetsp:Transcript_19247/g.27070  ORF Transcript_19247/g.27070 Transcript_19247/m.27070 type:complete len:386 (+) Transcript_19247:96-1253(+)